MLRPATRSNSPTIQFRKRVPLDIAEKVRGRTLKIVIPATDRHPAEEFEGKFGKVEFNLSLRTAEKSTGIKHHRAVLDAFDNYCDQIRYSKPSSSHEDARMLGEDLFRAYAFEHDGREQGSTPLPRDFDPLLDKGLKEVSERKIRTPIFYPDRRKFSDETSFKEVLDGPGTHYPIISAHLKTYDPEDRSLEALESRFGVICTWMLRLRETPVKDEDRWSLLKGFEQALAKARVAQAIHKSRHAQRLVMEEDSNKMSIATLNVTFNQILNDWIKETDPAPGTITSWKSVVKGLTDFLGHDNAANVIPEDLFAWKKELLDAGKISKLAISAKYFPAIRRIYSYAMETRMLVVNPASDLRLAKKSIKTESRQPYTDADIEIILTAAKSASKPIHKYVPWLLALTGARASEITMLWSDQIKEEDGIWYLDIRASKDGARLKTENSKRKVPLHPAIINPNGLNFLEFVQTRKGKPLFYEPKNISDDKSHPARNLVSRMSEWVRKLGLDLTDKDANHAARHYFKTKLIKVGVSIDLANVIQGHSRAGEYAKYLHYDMTQLAEAVAKLPAPAWETLKA